MRDFDLVVIGGGAAAFAAATKANDLGRSAVLINDGLPIGGTCVNVGCVPSKHLLHLAELVHRPRHPAWPAVRPVTPAHDFGEAIRGTGRLVETIRGTNYVDVISSLGGAEHVQACARLVSPNEVEADGERYRGRAVLVATGSRPQVPPVPGLAEAGSWTSREALEADRLPGELVVVGAGPTGLELGQAFLRLGSRVTMLGRAAHILPRFEPLVADELERALTDEGMAIHTSAQVTGVRREGGRKIVTAEVDGETRDFPCDEVLVAAGVRANGEEFGLAGVGVRLDARGFVETDEQMRTSVPSVYAAGDVAGHMFLESLAAKEGAVAAENALTGSAKTINYEHVPQAVFTDPQVASVGITEAEEMRRWNACSCRHVMVSRVPKAQTVGDRYGLIQLVAHPETSVLVGAHMVGPLAADLIHEAVLAVKFGLTVDDLIDTAHVFPTHSEGIKLAALAFTRDISVMACCIG